MNTKAFAAALIIPLLIAVLGLIAAGRATAQTFTTLHSFGFSDGGYPIAGLILSGNTLYGTTERGGANGNGTVFAVNTDGTGFTNLYSFTASSSSPPYTNSDGAAPQAGLVLLGNTLFGTASGGGSSDSGTVFAVKINGTGFTNLHSFQTLSGVHSTNADGASPYGGLVLSGNTLFGTAYSGGTSGNGTLFAINTDGTGFTNLHSFTSTSFFPPPANGDGANPHAGLILSGSRLYGTAFYGGGSGGGSVFTINTNGSGFTNLYSFTALASNTNSDGANPYAGLILSGDVLFGTASEGGTSGDGTIFAINTDGSGFTNLHNFTGQNDGGFPYAGLALSGNTLYGTASFGGLYGGNGVVYEINTNGTSFGTLYNFDGGADGSMPEAGLILSGDTLYGTAVNAGTNGLGTVFSLTLPVPPPQLTITPYGEFVILTWPTNSTVFTLQCTTNLDSSAVWSSNFSGPVVVIGGQNLVINPITGPQMFFRLIGN